MALTPPPSKKILVPTFDTLEVVEMDKIVFLQAYENYCKIQLESEGLLVSTQAFGKYAEMLECSTFFQCHKSYIVNISQVKRYHKSGRAELIDGSQIPVARRRKDDFIEAIWPNKNQYEL